MQPGLRQLLGDATSDLLQISRDLIIFDDREIALELLADDFSQFSFLARSEQEFCRSWSGSEQWWTTGLGARSRGQED